MARESTGGLSRRSFLSNLARAGAVGGAGLMAPSLLAACGGRGGGSAGGDLTAQVFATGLDPTTKLLPAFTQQYGKAAKAITIPSDYYTVTEARFLGGTPPFDSLDFDPGYVTKFSQNGWITDLDGLPGVDKLKADMYPSTLEALTGPDGKLWGLPFYTNIKSLFANQEALAQNGMSVAKDWDELLDQGKSLKAAGVPTPVVPVWTTKFNLTKEQFVTECVSRDMQQQFDDNLDPLWDKDPVARQVLDFWRQLQDADLVPADALTIDHQQSTSVVQSGRGVYMWFNSYQLKKLNTPGQSVVAGKMRAALMPGQTQMCGVSTSMTFQTKRSNREEAWQLTSFLSGLDKDGRYTGPLQRSAIANGVLLGYKSANADPAVAQAWAQWANKDDLDVMSKQLELSVGEGTVQNQKWYPDYSDFMTKTLSQYLAKQISADDALGTTAEHVRTLKAQQ